MNQDLLSHSANHFHSHLSLFIFDRLFSPTNSRISLEKNQRLSELSAWSLFVHWCGYSPQHSRFRTQSLPFLLPLPSSDVLPSITLLPYSVSNPIRRVCASDSVTDNTFLRFHTRPSVFSFPLLALPRNRSLSQMRLGKVRRPMGKK